MKVFRFSREARRYVEIDECPNEEEAIIRIRQLKFADPDDDVVYGPNCWDVKYADWPPVAAAK